jgi:methanogenic corrinoid protein MtbC1
MVENDWFDAIGFSLGTEARLDWLKTSIREIRQRSRNRSIAILVGGQIFLLNPGLVAEVGADATAPDALQAPACAEAVVAERLRRTARD